MKPYTVRKPTHKWFAPRGTPAIAIGQLRGQTLCINRLDDGGNVIERSIANAASWDLTGYGEGVSPYDGRRVQIMQGAWIYQFGPNTQPLPAYCETHSG